MAFLQVVRVHVSGGLSGGIQTFEETWKVESDRMYESPAAVARAGVLSAYTWYSPYHGYPAARLKDIQVEQTDDFTIWTVKFKWDTELDEFDRSIPPEMRPWHFDYGTVSTERLLVSDLTVDDNGDPAPRPVANSAGIPYDPPPSIPVSNPTITITLFRTTANPGKQAYVNSVNDEEFEGWPAGHVRCTDYKQTPMNEAEWGDFYQYTLSFEVRVDKPWNPIEILDAGTAELIGEGENRRLVAITEFKTGAPVTSPVPMDGLGGRLPWGSSADAFIYNRFIGYRDNLPWLYIIDDNPFDVGDDSEDRDDENDAAPPEEDPGE